MKCERCKGTGTLFDMMLNDIICDVCDGGGIVMSREEKIAFILEGYKEFECGYIDNLDNHTDEWLDKEVEWIGYLWTK